jgi:CBS domain containing-hemolysin-like protein
VTAIQLQIGIGLSLAAGLLLSWLSYAARDFSRKKLDDLCRARNHPQRFGEILKNHEQSLCVVDLLSAINIVILLGFSFTLLNLWQPDERTFSAWTAYIVEIALIAVTFLLITLILPWTLARVAGESLLERTWPILRFLQSVFRPYLFVLNRIDQIFHRLTGVEEPTEGDTSMISDEILTVVDEGQREGLIEREARTMIHRVIEMREVDASNIMTPRTEIISVPITATLEEARKLLVEEGHSRVPVIGENTDDIRGTLYAKDLLKCVNGEAERLSLADVMRDPLYVPETTGVDALLQTMKSERVQMAIVLDEYGGVSGLVTMEDVLEEIVGDIDDEYDEIEEEGVTVVNKDCILVEGRMHLDELNELAGYDLPEDGDYDTIAGFVVSQLGHIPDPGEVVSWKHYRISVLEADKRKIVKVQIDRDPSLLEVGSDESL